MKSILKWFNPADLFDALLSRIGPADILSLLFSSIGQNFIVTFLHWAVGQFQSLGEAALLRMFTIPQSVLESAASKIGANPASVVAAGRNVAQSGVDLIKSFMPASSQGVNA